ncbi:DUF6545 domain-containing protein [Nocardia amamiensis]|uniref:DUF6545 domain-containing protein n=1 Tax=Nocardia amamiensis TaxID=404578 RepID=UPI002B4AE834|nr:DUF6545 domain-containing protein [Nocardia amamiensis]
MYCLARLLLRLDRDSRALRRLYPVWRDLTAATPGVVLTLRPGDRRDLRLPNAFTAAGWRFWTRRRPSSADGRRHCQNTSISWSRTATCPNTIGRRCSVRELAAASSRLVAKGGAHRAGDPPLSHYHVPELQTLVRFWQLAGPIQH